ncbi:hypothetical protein Tco_1328995 [Tanacetum coccineum]
MQPVAPPSSDFIPGPEEPQAPLQSDFVHEPVYPEFLVPSDAEAPMKEQPYAADASLIALSPGDDDDDDDDDDDYDVDDEEEETSDTKEEEEEHLAPADPSIVPVVDPIPSAGDTEAVEAEEPAPAHGSPRTRVPFSQTRLRRARKTVRLEPPMSPSMEARIAEYAALPTPPLPPPSPLSPWSSPLPQIPSPPLLPPLPPPTADSPTYAEAPLGYREAGIRMRASSPPVPASLPLPSSPLPPLLQTRIFQSVEALVDDRQYHYETGHLATTLGEIRALQARDQTCADAPEGAAPMTATAVEQLIAERVSAALANHETLRNNTNGHGDGSHNSGTRIRRTTRTLRECTYKDFLNCHPLNFKGTEWVVMLAQWFEKMESVFHIRNCVVENQVKFATCTFIGNALTWWNSHMKAVTQDVAYAMD